MPIEWKKLGRPRNWEKLGVRIGNVRVVRTSKNIIIHPGRLRGFDVDELLMLRVGLLNVFAWFLRTGLA